DFILVVFGVRVLPVVLGMVLGGALGGGGVWVGRHSAGTAWWVGLGAGLVVGFVNMLVLGSVLAKKPAEGMTGLSEHAALFAAGYLVLSGVLAVVGAQIGRGLRRAGTPEIGEQGWMARLALVLCLALLPLLFIGGLVTSTASGMAVPDWPTTFGANMFLYPVSLMTGKVYYEHTHRLFGTLVGVTAIVLMAASIWRGPTGRVRLATVVLLLVITGQGLLGAYRVTHGTAKGAADAAPAAVVAANPPVLPEAAATAAGREAKGPKALAMLHGVSGQLTFAFAVGVMGVLMPAFGQSERGSSKAPRRLRGLALGLLAALVVQLVFGAMLRHRGGAHATWSHIGFSVVVMLLAVVLGFMLKKAAADKGDSGSRVFRLLGGAILHGAGLQFVLGWVAFLALSMTKDPAESGFRIAFGTAHQFNGALLLASAVLTVIWTRRLIAKS
ncbi:MAG: COX15/CtaA family protein, partial [Phycisphaerales bacterium]